MCVCGNNPDKSAFDHGLQTCLKGKEMFFWKFSSNIYDILAMANGTVFGTCFHTRAGMHTVALQSKENTLEK